MRQGAYDYLLKPIEKDQLLATVRRAIDYRRLVQQNALYRQDLEQMVSARTGMLQPGDRGPGAVLRHHAGGAG